MGHVTVTTPTFWKYLSGVMWGLFPGTRLPNLKFVPSAVLEQTDRDRQTRRGLSSKWAWLMVTTPTAGHTTHDTRHTTYDTQTVQTVLEYVQ